MPNPRPRSPYAVEAAELLGARISAARRERRWSQRELAERAGITDDTLSKIERGNLGVAIGTVFEVAALLGVALFYDDRDRVRRELDHERTRGALLPQSVRKPPRDVDDDF